MKWVEEKLVPPMAKIGTQRHLLAIRNGVVSTLSLILIGTFFMVFINLPFPGWNEFIAPYSATIVLPFRMTMGLMAIYATFVMGSDLAKSYGLDVSNLAMANKEYHSFAKQNRDSIRIGRKIVKKYGSKVL